MTRKIAIGIAGALVAALMAGTVALSLGRGIVGATPSTANSPKPIVRTETKVVTVRRHDPPPKGDQTITVVRPGPAAGSAPGAGGDDSFERDDMAGGSADD